MKKVFSVQNSSISHGVEVHPSGKGNFKISKGQEYSTSGRVVSVGR